MKKLLLTLLLPAAMFSQVVTKNELDPSGAKTVRVNAGAGKTFKEADGAVTGSTFYVGGGSLSYSVDGQQYNTPYLSLTFSGLPEGTCLKNFEDMAVVTFDDGSESALYQQSMTDCGEHLGVYVADYSVMETDMEKFKTVAIKKVTLNLKTGKKEYVIKADKKKSIKDTFVLLSKTM